ncbi:MAG: hypothetical protein JO256_13505 [Alphaproteobacteria bacterium]|nr:hypothetical protein [Alphaproteobacteria bacterium]
MEYEDDIDNITIGWKVGYIVGILTIYAGFEVFAQNAQAIVAAGSFASIALVARVRWNLRRFTWYWAFLAVAVLIHLLLIAAFHGTIDVHPTIILAPLGIADYAALFFSLAYLEKAVRS